VPDRVAWAKLPAGLRARIEAQTGPVSTAEPVGTGHNSEVALAVHAANCSMFLKGVRDDHPRAVRTQAAEARINPVIAPVTARLAFHLREEGWDILGFQYLAGYRHASLRPGSPDLPAITSVLARLAAIPGPPGGGGLRTIEDRWAEYIGDRARLLAGSVVAHTDLHRHNIMISGAQARLIDWAWPTLAAPWVDTACAGLQLIVAGHDPAQAEAWCQQSPAYRAASPAAITAFTDAASAMWQEIAAQGRHAWTPGVAAAAAQWARHHSR
jgi:hypothetical protein